jgi:hypothetical protein
MTTTRSLPEIPFSLHNTEQITAAHHRHCGTVLPIWSACFSVPATSTVESVISDLGLTYVDDRVARSLARSDIDAVLTELRSNYRQINPNQLGCIGIEEHLEQTISWNVVYDARGHFTEPHTQVEVALGTLEVRQYLGERPGFGPAIKLNSSTFFPTRGPENRYSTVLFIEKEGFDPLLQAARIAERFDIAIMSTKGMSVTASRLLLDRLSVRGVTKVLVLHDFDRTAFSIFGTLGTDGRRYRFENRINLIDIGLR